jgi:hypothetical protein
MERSSIGVKDETLTSISSTYVTELQTDNY